MVIVAIANLIVRNRIILINDRNASEFQETANRVSSMKVLLSVNKVMRNKQHLCGHQ